MLLLLVLEYMLMTHPNQLYQDQATELLTYLFNLYASHLSQATLGDFTLQKLGQDTK